MNYLIACAFILNLAACAESQPSFRGEILSPESSSDAGIVGGTEIPAVSTDATRAVLILGKDQGVSYVCTGVMIAEDVVLTAAHCLREPESIKIVFGTDPVHIAAEQITGLKKFIKHESYNREQEVRNDIALIQTEDPKPKKYSLAKLPWQEPSVQKVLRTELEFKVLGYGATSGLPSQNAKDLRGIGVLRGTQLKISQFSKSQDVFYAEQNKGHAACSGDSGGPAFALNNTVIGFLSYAVTDDPERPELADADACNYKSVYTNVLSYKAWILKGLHDLRNSEE